MSGEEQSSSTGLDAELAATLAYLFGWVSGVIFLLLERQSEFVRFHAIQSTVVFLALTALGLVARVLPLVGDAVEFLLAAGSFILWVVLLVKAWQGERFELPLIGEFALERAEIEREVA